MKKILFLVTISIFLFTDTFSQTLNQRLPKKPKKIRVSDIVTYGLPDSLNLPPSRPLPAYIPCVPKVPTEPLLSIFRYPPQETPNEVLEERLIIVVHKKPQEILIKTGLENGSELSTFFTTSTGEIMIEKFQLSSQVKIISLWKSEIENGLVHFRYEDRNGIVRIIDFYIP